MPDTFEMRWNNGTYPPTFRILRNGTDVIARELPEPDASRMVRDLRNAADAAAYGPCPAGWSEVPAGVSFETPPPLPLPMLPDA